MVLVYLLVMILVIIVNASLIAIAIDKKLESIIANIDIVIASILYNALACLLNVFIFFWR